MSHAHTEDQAQSAPHSHKKHYLIIAAILTVVTGIELGIPFLKNVPSIWVPFQPVWVPLLLLLSVGKFGAVVGEFMHLRQDRSIFKILFISPLALALLCLTTVTLMSIVHFEPFGKGYAATAVDLRNGYTPPSDGPKCDPPLPDDQFKAAYAKAEGAGFETGKKIFGEKCVACHGPAGGGMPNLGLNLTDTCYKYGGTFKDLYQTVALGRADGRMPSQAAALKSEEIRQVAYFVRSLRGKNVPGGQPCVGEPAKD